MKLSEKKYLLEKYISWVLLYEKKKKKKKSPRETQLPLEWKENAGRQ